MELLSIISELGKIFEIAGAFINQFKEFLVTALAAGAGIFGWLRRKRKGLPASEQGSSSHHINPKVQRLRCSVLIQLLDASGRGCKFTKHVVNKSLVNGTIEYDEKLEGSGRISNVNTKPYFIRETRTVAGATRFLSVFPSCYEIGEVFEGVLTADLEDCFTANREEWTEHIQGETDELQIEVCFPAARPCLLLRPVKYDAASVKPISVLPQELKPTLSSDKLSAMWRVPKPAIGALYGLEWDW